MTRNEALDLLNNLIENENLKKHMVATESIMKGLAKKLDGDKEKWGLAGLLHDADYELTKDAPDKHTLVLKEKIEEAGLEIEQDVLHAIQAHNYEHTGVEPNSKMDWALISGDDLGGLIVATALVMPDRKLSQVRVESVMKKFKSNNFAQGVKRGRIAQCEEKLGIELEDFIEICLRSLQEISDDLGL